MKARLFLFLSLTFPIASWSIEPETQKIIGASTTILGAGISVGSANLMFHQPAGNKILFDKYRLRTEDIITPLKEASSHSPIYQGWLFEESGRNNLHPHLTALDTSFSSLSNAIEKTGLYGEKISTYKALIINDDFINRRIVDLKKTLAEQINGGSASQATKTISQIESLVDRAIEAKIVTEVDLPDALKTLEKYNHSAILSNEDFEEYFSKQKKHFIELRRYVDETKLNAALSEVQNSWKTSPTRKWAGRGLVGGVLLSLGGLGIYFSSDAKLLDSTNPSDESLTSLSSSEGTR